jgi:hypothetical protein
MDPLEDAPAAIPLTWNTMIDVRDSLHPAPNILLLNPHLRRIPVPKVLH